MFHLSKRRSTRARRGTVTVEFAICAPILFLFLFAILEFGRAQMIQHTLDNAVYEGVRRGMSINSTEDKVRERVFAITIPAAIHNPAIGVSLTQDAVTVSASVNLNDHALFSPIFLRNKTLSSTLTLSRR